MGRRYFLSFFKIPISIFNAQQTSGDCKCSQVPGWEESPEGVRTKKKGRNDFLSL